MWACVHEVRCRGRQGGQEGVCGGQEGVCGAAGAVQEVVNRAGCWEPNSRTQVLCGSKPHS